MAKKKNETAGKPVTEEETSPTEKLNDPVGDFSEEELREFQCQCSNLTRDIRKRAAVMDEAKRKAKFATEDYNAATVKLTAYISGFQEMPLLNQAEDVDSWRTTLVADLDIEVWIATAIVEAGIYTAGTLDAAIREGESIGVAEIQHQDILVALDKIIPATRDESE